jgi:hypothetical protein
MLKGISKLLLCAALTLALGSLATQAAWAGCGCGKCARKACSCQSGCHKSCGCNKCAQKKSCGCKRKSCGCNKCNSCGCAPDWCGDGGIGGYKIDLTCADACCLRAGCEDEVCVDGWDLCQKWSDGLIHHPYELVYNGHGMLCDIGSCSAFIPCKRHGVICRTECKSDACGCGCPETTCETIERPRTIPWWFNPGHGNTYLDENGQPICGQSLPLKETVAEPSAPPQAVEPPAPPVPPTPPAPPTPPVETPPSSNTTVIDGRG